MEIEEIKRQLEIALQELIAQDSHLLIENLSEQSMTHRLALHLTPKFPEYDVDCEYNGNVDSETCRKEIFIWVHSHSMRFSELTKILLQNGQIWGDSRWK